MNNKIKDIRDILFNIIDENYPEIPKDVVEKILTIQFENSENACNASRQVVTFLNNYLNKTDNA